MTVSFHIEQISYNIMWNNVMINKQLQITIPAAAHSLADAVQPSGVNITSVGALYIATVYFARYNSSSVNLHSK